MLDSRRSGFAPELSGPVTSVEVQANGKILVGGVFEKLDGDPACGVARLRADGKVDAAFQSPKSGTRVLDAAVQEDWKVVACGQFKSEAEKTAQFLARFKQDGTNDESFKVEITRSDSPERARMWQVVTVALQPDGKVVIAGRFKAVNGTNRPGLARLNTDGTLDETFDPRSGPDGGEVYGITVRGDGRILVCGPFTRFAGMDRAGVALLADSGALDEGFAPTDGDLRGALGLRLDNGGKVLVNRFPGKIDGCPYGGFARLNADGRVDGSLKLQQVADASMTRVRMAYAMPDGRLLLALGPDFRKEGPNPSRLYMFKPEGTLDTSFAQFEGFNGDVVGATVMSNGKLLVWGAFSSVDGCPRNNLARLQADGKVDEE